MSEELQNGIFITLPSRGDTDWDELIKDGCFKPLAEHNHDGSPTGGFKISNSALLGSDPSEAGTEAVNTNVIRDNAITEQKVQDGAITDAKINSSGVSLSKLNLTGINGQGIDLDSSNQLTINLSQSDFEYNNAPGTFTDGWRIREVDGSKITGFSIDGNKLAFGTLGVSRMQQTSGYDSMVGKGLMVDSNRGLSVDINLAEFKFSPSLNYIQLQDASFSSVAGIATSKLQDNAITSAKLSSSSTVDSDRAVNTDHIKDAAITNDKLSSVSLTKLEAGSANNGEVLAYSSSLSQWVPTAASSGGGGVSIDEITSASDAANYNGTAKFIKIDDGGSTIDFTFTTDLTDRVIYTADNQNNASRIIFQGVTLFNCDINSGTDIKFESTLSSAVLIDACRVKVYGSYLTGDANIGLLPSKDSSNNWNRVDIQNSQFICEDMDIIRLPNVIPDTSDYSIYFKNSKIYASERIRLGTVYAYANDTRIETARIEKVPGVTDGACCLRIDGTTNVISHEKFESGIRIGSAGMTSPDNNDVLWGPVQHHDDRVYPIGGRNFDLAVRFGQSNNTLSNISSSNPAQPIKFSAEVVDRQYAYSTSTGYFYTPTKGVWKVTAVINFTVSDQSANIEFRRAGAMISGQATAKSPIFTSTYAKQGTERYFFDTFVTNQLNDFSQLYYTIKNNSSTSATVTFDEASMLTIEYLGRI